MAKTYKVSQLRMSDDPRERKVRFRRFVDDMKSVFNMSSKTVDFLSDFPSITRPNRDYINEAIWNVTRSLVHPRVCNLIEQHAGDGYAAWCQLQTQFDHISSADRTADDTAFKTTVHRRGESAFQFITRFQAAKNQALQSGNKYDDEDVIEHFLANFRHPGQYENAIRAIKVEWRQDQWLDPSERNVPLKATLPCLTSRPSSWRLTITTMLLTLVHLAADIVVKLGTLNLIAGKSEKISALSVIPALAVTGPMLYNPRTMPTGVALVEGTIEASSVTLTAGASNRTKTLASTFAGTAPRLVTSLIVALRRRRSRASPTRMIPSLRRLENLELGS